MSTATPKKKKKVAAPPKGDYPIGGKIADQVAYVKAQANALRSARATEAAIHLISDLLRDELGRQA